MVKKKTAKKRAPGKTSVETLVHEDRTRYNIPTAEIQPVVYDRVRTPIAVAYAEVRVFVPKKRLVWWWHDPAPYRWDGWLGPTSDEDADEEDLPDGWWEVEYQPNVSEAWTLWNQHWTTQPALSTLLQTPPPLPEFSVVELSLPNLSDVTTEEMGRISPH